MEAFLLGAGECEAGEGGFGDGGSVLNNTAGGDDGGYAERGWLPVKTGFTVAAVPGDGFADGALATDKAE